MGRKPKPWWWEDRNGYYAFVGGTRHRLAETKKEADRVLAALLKAPIQQRVAAESLAALLDAFLQWTEENRSPKTYRGYLDFCQSFKDFWPRLRVADLTPQHVTEWLDTKTKWNSTTKRGAITCLQRAMNWALNNWNVQRNPLHRMEKPEAKRREKIISDAEFKAILTEVKDTAFRELLIVSNEVGCRASEVKQLEARHFQPAHHCLLIPKEETKGRRKPRAIYLTVKAEKIIKRIAKENPTGKLFRNLRGKPWTASAVKCRFARLEETLGTRYCQTLFRHTWITRKILAGTDSHVVGALAGHSDSSMIDRVYSKVAADHKFMLEAARRA